jgi:hypothetical protein
MVIHYPPARLRHNSDRPTAITNFLVTTAGSSYHTAEITLGTPTCSARTRHGRWALYPNGEEVVVVWPGGALTGPPAEVAGELDRGAAWSIRQFLTDLAAGDATRWSSTRTRTWSSPAAGYWLSGLTNQPDHHPQANRPDAPTPAPPIPLPDSSPQPTPARAA